MLIFSTSMVIEILEEHLYIDILHINGTVEQYILIAWGIDWLAACIQEDGASVDHL